MANFEQYSLNLSLIALAAQRLGILCSGRSVVSFVLPSSHATSSTMGYSRDVLVCLNIFPQKNCGVQLLLSRSVQLYLV